MATRRLALLWCCALAACSGANSSGGTSALHVRAATPLRATGTMHIAVTSPQAIAVDLPSARCSLDTPAGGNGGLRIAADGNGAVRRAIILARRIAGDGDDASPGDAASAIRAPLRAEISLSDGVIVTGGTGSQTGIHTTDGGKTGTLTFTHATYAGSSGALDASGTISWSCT
jgi:hypothetical protein